MERLCGGHRGHAGADGASDPWRELAGSRRSTHRRRSQFFRCRRIASALALLSLNGAQISPPEIAKLCQRSENLFVGARVGIMDQFVSCLGKEDYALLLDCRSLEFKLISIPENLRLVICNTMVKT